MAHGRLNPLERYRIHALLEAGASLRGIALALKRSPSTISRELRRNRPGKRYQPDQAQHLSERRRSKASRRRWITLESIERITQRLALGIAFFIRRTG